MRKIVTIIFCLLFFLPFLSNAQSFSSQNFYLTVSPENPGPNTNVVVEAQSYTIDLDSSTINWYENGKLVLSGTGKKKLQTTSGSIGSTIKIEAVVGGNKSSVVLKPAVVDLLWEAQTYVPFWYKGKALHSSQSVLKVVAVPYLYSGSSRIDPDNLIYNWERNFKPLPSNSGYGKNILTIVGPKKYGTDSIQVTVTTKNKTLSASGFVSIEATNPEILFYEETPLAGIVYNRLLPGIIDLASDEISVRAEPFYFSLLEMNKGALSYQWEINNKKVSDPTDKNLITLRQEGGEGEAEISLSITNPLRVLQSAIGGFVVSFGKLFDNLESF